MVPKKGNLLFLSLPGAKKLLGQLWGCLRIVKDALVNAYMCVAASFAVHFHEWSLYQGLLCYFTCLFHKEKTEHSIVFTHP